MKKSEIGSPILPMILNPLTDELQFLQIIASVDLHCKQNFLKELLHFLSRKVGHTHINVTKIPKSWHLKCWSL